MVSIFMAGCSVFGNSNVETAPYKVIKTAENQNIEIRRYDSLVLASTPMNINKEATNRRSAFMNLFGYISGDNAAQNKIAMTAPVIMDDKKKDGTKISMTAPVFMDESAATPIMSFVLPESYTIDTAPKPTNSAVQLSELKDYTVATIRFNGRLTDSNIQKHKEILESWMNDNEYKATGNYKTAGYNPPFTLPVFRRNEVLIPVE